MRSDLSILVQGLPYPSHFIYDVTHFPYYSELQVSVAHGIQGMKDFKEYHRARTQQSVGSYLIGANFFSFCIKSTPTGPHLLVKSRDLAVQSQGAGRGGE